MSAFILSGCIKATSDSTGTTAPPTPATPFTAAELSSLDRLTTLESIFPTAADRALYNAADPVIENHTRSYTFLLKPQPGMNPSRHFQAVTITWMRPDANVKSGSATSGTGGPNGSFVEKVVQTPDRAYNIRVTRGELLPGKAKTGAVDVDRLAQKLLDNYTETRKK